MIIQQFKIYKQYPFWINYKLFILKTKLTFLKLYLIGWMDTNCNYSVNYFRKYYKIYESVKEKLPSVKIYYKV